MDKQSSFVPADKEECKGIAERITRLKSLFPHSDGSAESRRDAERWDWATHRATQADWQAMAARCTTTLALDRYADAAIDKERAGKAEPA